MKIFSLLFTFGLMMSGVAHAQSAAPDAWMGCGSPRDSQGMQSPDERMPPVVLIKNNQRSVQSSQDLEAGVHTDELHYVASGSNYDLFETSRYTVKFLTPWMNSNHSYAIAQIQIKNTAYKAYCLVGTADFADEPIIEDPFKIFP